MPFFVFLLNRAKLTSKGADLSAISGKQAAYSYLWHTQSSALPLFPFSGVRGKEKGPKGWESHVLQ